MISNLVLRSCSAVLLLLFVSSAPAALAQRQTQLIEEVRVTGYRRLQREEIFKHIATKPGDAFAKEKVDRDFNGLLNLGLFNKETSRVLAEPGTRGGLVLTFEVYELPLIDHVEFQGWPPSISQVELLELLSTKAHIAKDAVCDPVNGKKGRRLVAEYLATQGLPNAQVNVMYEQLEMNKVIVTFEIRARF
jgi:outer membrane protein assembly factor BamA